MDVYRSVETLRQALEPEWSSKSRIGFVPTMGFLHEGHLSLARAARGENTKVIASIYLNPTQFNDASDLENYPRDEARDLTLLEREGVDGVFIPPHEEMYPDGFSTYIDPPANARRWEGERRPGHFRGVCTVVAILFNLTRPTRAYFGRKDAQQLAVIRRIAKDLRLGVEVVPCPTVREPDGLAMSSRNVHLSPKERNDALILSQTLLEGVRLYRSGVRNAERFIAQGEKAIQSIPGVRLDYLAVVNQNTFEPVVTIGDDDLFIGAIRVGRTRLIDNQPFAQSDLLFP